MSKTTQNIYVLIREAGNQFLANVPANISKWRYTGDIDNAKKFNSIPEIIDFVGKSNYIGEARPASNEMFYHNGGDTLSIQKIVTKVIETITYSTEEIE